MKQLLLFFTASFFLSAAYAQWPVAQPGLGTAVGTIYSMGREIRQAQAEKERQREQEELDFAYAQVVTLADTFYSHQEYEKAISHYERALGLKNETYAKTQLAKAKTELGRRNRDPYQRNIDEADSLYALLMYDAATLRYQKALELKDEKYPKDQVAKIQLETERWQKVHFSGLVIAGKRTDDQTSKAFSDDPWSDFVAVGKYEWIDRALTYSNFQTLDGIAVPPDTRLIIYRDRQFKGPVLLDVTGPAIIYNVVHMPPADILSQAYTPARLEETFPKSTRMQSSSDMQQWVNGSMEITHIK